jgi:transposase
MTPGKPHCSRRLCTLAESSRPLMEKFETWLKEQIAEKKVEPNSGLGQAISYVKNHWRPLTLFLRVAGAPLDNNVCERALKKAILHRKGSLFYKTQNGAHVGDLFMSLIHSCQLSETDPFDYLTELQRHAKELTGSPQDWMPWNYGETLGRSSPPRAGPS